MHACAHTPGSFLGSMARNRDPRLLQSDDMTQHVPLRQMTDVPSMSPHPPETHGHTVSSRHKRDVQHPPPRPQKKALTNSSFPTGFKEKSLQTMPDGLFFFFSLSCPPGPFSTFHGPSNSKNSIICQQISPPPLPACPKHPLLPSQ